MLLYLGIYALEVGRITEHKFAKMDKDMETGLIHEQHREDVQERLQQLRI